MIKYPLLTLFTCIFLTGCLYYPTTMAVQDDGCKLHTKKLTLDHWSVDVTKGVNDTSEFVVVAAGYTVTAAVSGIVSGSIMMVGNTVHWIEKEGRCDDGLIKNAIDDLSDSVSSIGGWFVTSIEDIYNVLRKEDLEENNN